MKKVAAFLLACLLGVGHAQEQYPKEVQQVIDVAGLFLYECQRPGDPLTNVCGYTQLDFAAFKEATAGVGLERDEWKYSEDVSWYSMAFDLAPLASGFVDDESGFVVMRYALGKGGLGDVRINYYVEKAHRQAD